MFAAESEIPEKNQLMDMLGALADRVKDMLMAVDKIGQRYYEGVTNTGKTKTVYHFNYWLTLYAGVLDNLALITQLRYKIIFPDVKKIGLNGIYAYFLKVLGQHNPEIGIFLSLNRAIVNLNFDSRNVVIHRERLKVVGFQNKVEGLDLTMLRISKDFFKSIVLLSQHQGNKLNKWGHYKTHSDYFFEPYRFVKEATLYDFTLNGTKGWPCSAIGLWLHRPLFIP